MSERNVEYARRWLEKAHNDLVTAEQTLLLEDGPTDTPCFHAQQAIEKTLKAILTAHGITTPRTHDLLLLLEMVLPIFQGSDTWRETLAEMSDYGVAVRYPADWPEPEREEAEAALVAARNIWKTARQFLSEDSDNS